MLSQAQPFLHRGKKDNEMIYDSKTSVLWSSRYSFVFQPLCWWKLLLFTLFNSTILGDLQMALHSASHAVLNSTSLYINCDTKDLGTECGTPWNFRSPCARILLYDNHAGGGIGISQRIANVFLEVKE